jgi:hypothetical protein
MSRFEVRNETVLDRQTGLEWTKHAALTEFPLTWEEGFGFIKALNQSKRYGFDDWKLPNRKELFSIISQEAINPSLPPSHPFVNVFTGYYWTSTSCVRLPDQAWYIHLGGARVFKGMKRNAYMIWPVRVADVGDIRIFQSGQRHCYDENGEIIPCNGTGQDGEFQSGLRIPEPRFTVSGDLVHDTATDLTWFLHANVGGKMLDWQSAIGFVEDLNTDMIHGHADWRLPTIAELESLTDMGRHTPALPERFPFNHVQDYYWSSTPSRYDKKYAWALYLEDGAVGVGYKPLPEFYLWPVRGSGYL